MLNEFKAFIAKGNVLELAVGLILATYFGAIVKSLVDDIIMPPIGKLLNGVDFKELKLVIQEGIVNAETGNIEGEIAIGYGSFINTIITFFIVSFCVFLVIRAYNKFKHKKEEVVTEPGPSSEELLLTEIRDLLKERKNEA